MKRFKMTGSMVFAIVIVILFIVTKIYEKVTTPKQLTGFERWLQNCEKARMAQLDRENAIKIRLGMKPRNKW